MRIGTLRNLEFPAIDGIRAYAALMVVAQHVIGGLITEYFRLPGDALSYSNPDFGWRLLTWLTDGNRGVDIFFMLSGFLITRAVRRQSENFSYCGFLAGRVARIYPAFLVSLAVSAAFDCLLFGWQWNWSSFAGNLVFLNALPDLAILSYNHVTWTLGYEFAFYLLIPGLLCLKGDGQRKLAVALPIGLAFALAPPPYRRIAALFAGAFLGMCNDSELSSLAARIPLLVLLGAYLALSLTKPAGVKLPGFYAFFLVLAGLLFIKTVWGGPNLLQRLCSAPIVRWFGTISYSVYLFHSCIASLVLHYLTPAGLGLFGAAWCAFITSLLTLVVANVSYLAIERRYFKKSEKKVHETGKLAVPGTV